MAAGEIIGCFGLTEPDYGSDPAGMRTYAKRDGADWVLDRPQDVDHQRLGRRRRRRLGADRRRGIRGFVVPTDTPGFSAPEITHKWSLRASVTSELVLDDVRLPADAVLPDVTGLRGPLACLNDARYGIVWGDGRGPRLPRGGPRLRQEPRAVRPADRRLPAHPGQARRHGAGAAQGHPARPPPRPAEGRGRAAPRAGQRSASSTTCARRSRSAGPARTILGANGISLEYPVMRHATNLESVLTYEGTVGDAPPGAGQGAHRPGRLPVSGLVVRALGTADYDLAFGLGQEAFGSWPGGVPDAPRSGPRTASTWWAPWTAMSCWPRWTAGSSTPGSAGWRSRPGASRGWR